MPETVCVTVEQLREIEENGVHSWGYEEEGCPACGAGKPEPDYYVRDDNGDFLYDDEGNRIELEDAVQRPIQHKGDCWLANAIAQAERLKEWQPKVGDQVRLKAMPEAGLWTILIIDEGVVGRKAWLMSAGIRRPEMSRYLVELMPAEGE